MPEKIRILFLSANPWNTSRILVDKEAREIFERLEEGPCRDRFELHKHAAIRPGDLHRLLMKYQPTIVHFSGHGSKTCKIILEGTHGRGKQVDPQGLVDLFRFSSQYVRLVLLNACFTSPQASALAGVIDYSIGISRAIGDRAGVAFAGGFYRALGFGKPVPEAFASAKAELRLTKTPRSKGIELFVRRGIDESGTVSSADANGLVNRANTLGLALKELCGKDSIEDQARYFHSATVERSFILKQTHQGIESGTSIFETSAVSYARLSWSRPRELCLTSDTKWTPRAADTDEGGCKYAQGSRSGRSRKARPRKTTIDSLRARRRSPRV
jgi:hypothetical protein